MSCQTDVIETYHVLMGIMLTIACLVWIRLLIRLLQQFVFLLLKLSTGCYVYLTKQQRTWFAQLNCICFVIQNVVRNRVRLTSRTRLWMNLISILSIYY